MEAKIEHKEGEGDPMRVDTQDPASSVEPSEWDEERIQKAEKVLKDMYMRLRELRTTIPRLITPLTSTPSSPEVLFRQVSTAAAVANSDVRQFRHLVEDEESKRIFEHVKESRAQNPKGITPWKITQDPDWLSKNP